MWIADVGRTGGKKSTIRRQVAWEGRTTAGVAMKAPGIQPEFGCLPRAKIPSSSGITPIIIVSGCSKPAVILPGATYPDMYGYYIYTDYCSGRFWALVPDGQGGWENTELANLDNNQFVTLGKIVRASYTSQPLATVLFIV